jgi:hypothetical protein
MGNEPIIIVFVIIISCICSIALSMSGGLSYAGGFTGAGNTESGGDISQSQLTDALREFELEGDDEFITFDSQRVTNRDTPFAFEKYDDFSVGDYANLGDNRSGVTLDGCNSLCSTTSGCTGFVHKNNSCQLKNNVVILDRSRGSTIYASQDLGGVRYLKMPFGPIIAPGSESLWTINGQLGDAVANCYKNKAICTGFVEENNNTYKMYGPSILGSAIVGVDSQQSKNTYISPNNQVSFIKEGNYRYRESPGTDDTWEIDRNWTFPYTNGNVQLPQNDGEYFALWQNNWDAGSDGSTTANTIIVNNLSQCQNACVTNTWCQSFVYSNSAKTCHMRKNRTAQFFPARCRSQSDARNCSTIGGICGCPCGCAGEYPSSTGISDSQKTSYVKKQFPMAISCPMSCTEDGDCKMVTFTNTTCNKYKTIPVNRVADSSYTSVWNTKNFPR